MSLPSEAVILLAAAGVVLLAVALYFLWRARRARKRGRLVWADVRGRAPTLYSETYRLYGRPDQVRRLPDGTRVPVELKSRSAPMGGVPPSHQIQVGAYCLLLEETFRTRPPYGLLRYAGGVEFEIPFTDELRDEVVRVRRAVERPYDGAATPSAARCRRCPWRLGCDRAAA